MTHEMLVQIAPHKLRQLRHHLIYDIQGSNVHNLRGRVWERYDIVRVR